MKKKLIVLALVFMMVFAFVSCNNNDTPLDGGWGKVTETTAEDVARFNKAMGLELTDVKLVETQVVAGMNYKYEYVDEAGETKIVTIYEDLQGNLEVFED